MYLTNVEWGSTISLQARQKQATVKRSFPFQRNPVSLCHELGNQRQEQVNCLSPARAAIRMSSSCPNHVREQMVSLPSLGVFLRHSLSQTPSVSDDDGRGYCLIQL